MAAKFAAALGSGACAMPWVRVWEESAQKPRASTPSVREPRSRREAHHRFRTPCIYDPFRRISKTIRTTASRRKYCNQAIWGCAVRASR